MPDYTKKFLIEAGAKVRLKDLDPDAHGKHSSHHEAINEIQNYLEKMDALEDLLYAEGKHALLIVLQGLDAAGKDGVIRHVIRGMNPQGCSVTGFKQPTPEDLAHDFLWRVHPHSPRRGHVAIFNRSHYEDVLVARVHRLVPRATWTQRFNLINDWEDLLVKQNGTTILKFFLHISKEEQLARFKKRLEDPSRQWKISEGDYKERDFWADYIVAYEEMLEKTSRSNAPWFVIPSNHKWFRNLAISQIIVEALESLKLQRPQPTVDLKEILGKYHEDVREHETQRRKKAA